MAKISSRTGRRSRKAAAKGKRGKKTFDMVVEVDSGSTAIAPLYACTLKVTKITRKSGR